MDVKYVIRYPKPRPSNKTYNPKQFESLTKPSLSLSQVLTKP